LSDKHFWWIKPHHIAETHAFYEKYGAKTIIIGRFIPIVRSFSPAVAGAAEMKYGKFIHYTWIGGLIWTAGLTVTGFYLGRTFPSAHIYLTPIIVTIIIVSLLPAFWEYMRKRT
jgi:membrane-associated protein